MGKQADWRLDAVERRSHGCDGCRKQVPTERFDGYCRSHIWLCDDCLKILVREGYASTNKGEQDGS